MDIRDKNNSAGLFMKDGELPEDILAAQKLAEAEQLAAEAEALAKKYEEEGISPENAEIIEELMSKLDRLEKEEEEKELFAEKEEEVEDKDLTLEIYRKTPRPDIMDRLWPLMIDTAVVFIVLAPLYYLLIPGAVFTIGGMFLLYLFCVYVNFAELVLWIPLYLTNGYTLGKRLFKQRVVSLHGNEKLTLKEVFVRSFLIKGFCTVASYGMLNIASIICAYIRPHSRSIHDIAAKTVTVQFRPKYLRAEDKPVKFK